LFSVDISKIYKVYFFEHNKMRSTCGNIRIEMVSRLNNRLIMAWNLFAPKYSNYVEGRSKQN